MKHRTYAGAELVCNLSVVACSGSASSKRAAS